MTNTTPVISYEISDFLGEEVIRIEGMHKGSDLVRMWSKSGRVLEMWHDQCCCERVELEDVTGDPKDLLFSSLKMCESYSNSDDPPDEHSESHTWTFYKFATVNGFVTLRWLGESNGYYSEEVDVEIREGYPGDVYMKYEQRNNWQSVTYHNAETGEHFPGNAVSVTLPDGTELAVGWESVVRTYSDHGHQYSVASNEPRLKLDAHGITFLAHIDGVEIKSLRLE